MTVDWTKPIQTRGGEPAQFVKQLAGIANEPMLVIVTRDGHDYVRKYSPDGRYVAPDRVTDADIVNVPEEKLLGVVNIFADYIGICHEDRKQADRQVSVGGLNRTHVVTIKRFGDEVTATVERVQ